MKFYRVETFYEGERKGFTWCADTESVDRVCTLSQRKIHGIDNSLYSFDVQIFDIKPTKYEILKMLNAK